MIKDVDVVPCDDRLQITTNSISKDQQEIKIISRIGSNQ